MMNPSNDRVAEPRATRLTIGMPLYNNARTLKRAVSSLQAQTVSDFVLLLSDDGSTDETRLLAAEFAASDSRIHLFQQPRNLNYGNFRFVLQQAKTEYFMWAPGDDWWEPTFVERCIEELERHPEAVCCASQVVMHPDDGAAYVTQATHPLTDSWSANVVDYCCTVSDNSRMYGVFRTAVAQRAFPASDYYAFDWEFCLAALAEGTFLEVNERLMHREVTPSDRYVEYVRRDNHSRIDMLFPLLPLTRSLWRTRRIPPTRAAYRALLDLNLEKHREYVRRYHPRVARLYGGRRVANPHPPAPVSAGNMG